MRTWVLLLFCLAVVVAFAHAEKVGGKKRNGDNDDDRVVTKKVRGNDDRENGVKRNRNKPKKKPAVKGGKKSGRKDKKDKPGKKTLGGRKDRVKGKKGGQKKDGVKSKKPGGRKDRVKSKKPGGRKDRVKSKKGGEKKRPRPAGRGGSQKKTLEQKKRTRPAGRDGSKKKKLQQNKPKPAEEQNNEKSTKKRKKGGKKKALKPATEGSDNEEDGNNNKRPKKLGQKAAGVCTGTCVPSAEDCNGKVMKKQTCTVESEVCCKEGRKKNKKNKKQSGKQKGAKRFCKPLDPCTQLIGECNKKKSGCKEGQTLYKSSKKVKYCDKRSCVCCAKPCKQKKTCTREGGVCQSAKGTCDGELKTKNSKGKKYCKGKKCACCIPEEHTTSGTCGVDWLIQFSEEGTNTDDTCLCCSTTTESSTTTSTMSATPSTVSIAPEMTTRMMGTITMTAVSTTKTSVAKTATTTSAKTTPPKCNIKRFGDNCWDKSKAKNRIKGGTPAGKGEYPYHVGLLHTWKRYLCGGSILSEWWVLTAAHCVYDIDMLEIGKYVKYNKNSITVIYDSTDRYTLHNVGVSLLEPHKDFEFKCDPSVHTINDIALVKVCKSLTINHPGVKPICFTSKGNDVADTLTVTGWGKQGQGGSIPQFLQQATMKFITRQECEERMKKETTYFLPPGDSHICTYSEKQQTYYGDSGGPAVAEVTPGCWVQIGIVIYGRNATKERTGPAVYTRVSVYEDWICGKTGLCKPKPKK